MSKNKQNKTKLKQLKVQRGLDREYFIETNGDMKQWRPPRIVIPDKRKQKSKKYCRRKYRV